MSDVLVLCLHALSDRWAAPLSTTPQRLEDLLTCLVGKGYRGATFHEAITAPPAEKTLAVTFDDGYRSVYELALPILDRLELPATAFIATDFVGADEPMAWPGIEHWLDGPHASELLPMGWEELGRLAASGWEIGSHTRSHPRLTELPAADLESELEGSRQVCEERLGRPCRTLAYPYGDVDARVAKATRGAGYTAAAGLVERTHPPEPFLWPRVGVYQRDRLRRLRLKTSPAVRRLLGVAPRNRRGGSSSFTGR